MHVMKYTLFTILTLLSLLLDGCREGRIYGGQTANQSTLVKLADSTSADTPCDRINTKRLQLIAADSLRIYINKQRSESFSHKVSVYRLADTSKRHFVQDTACRKITIFYNGRINGYKVKVTARATNFHEINIALLEFKDKRGNKTWFEMSEYFDNYTFKHFEDSLLERVYNIDYTPREADKFLAYDTPFYFQDVNLDGEEELVFNSHLEGGRDNHACFVYSVSKKEFLTTPPFNLLTSGAEYDFKKRTITMFYSGGATYWTEYTYKFDCKATDPSKFDFYLKELVDCDDPTMSTYLYNSKGALISEKHEFIPEQNFK